MEDLQKGVLYPLLELVQKDYTLDLELRKGYVDIYYRGGVILKIKEKKQYYTAELDRKYISDSNIYDFDKLPDKISLVDHANEWRKAIPLLKYNMDLHFFDKNTMMERDITQHIVFENNYGKAKQTLSTCSFTDSENGTNVKLEKFAMENSAENMPSRTTDYYICDMECKTDFGELDLVGVKWLSAPEGKKNNKCLKLALIEVKYGNEAIDGDGGICSKIEMLNEKLNDDNLNELKYRMKCSFNQKIQLGLINNEKFIESFDKERPEFIFIIANYNCRGSELKYELDKLPVCDKPEIKFAIGHPMGYGLYAENMYDLESFLSKFDIDMQCK